MDIEPVNETNSTLWDFPYINGLACDAMDEVISLKGKHQTKTDCINKGLQVEAAILQARRKGGEFVIMTPDTTSFTEKAYDTDGPVRESFSVNLTPRSLNGLLLCASINTSEDYRFSEVLNRALQRWRDVQVAHENGWPVLLKESADSPWELALFS
jgi:hypothetical protein